MNRKLGSHGSNERQPHLNSRYFVEASNGNWTKIAANSFFPIYRGDESVTEFSGQTLRVAHVVIFKQKAERTRVSHLSISMWHFDSEGFVIQEEIDNAINEKMTGATETAPQCLIADTPTTEADLQSIFAALDAPLTTEFVQALTTIQQRGE